MRNMVVVGVDGSDKDDVALSWAAQIARSREAVLEVALGWSTQPDFAQRFAEHGDQILETALAKVKDLDPTLEVRGIKKAQPAAQLLEKLSEDADLVVVGEGHHPGLHALVDGSVGRDTVTHATSAVLLVRAPKEAAGRRGH
jgi:nucleotide-binding universal stress UspA family protein